jgi:ABC-type antimicrobial peptide transport system permease subunit
LAVLGSLGVRKSVLLAIVVGESVTVLVIGVGAGLAAGIFMARLAVDTTTQTTAIGAIVPPIQFSTEWTFIGVLVSGLVLAVVAIVTCDYIALRRINLAGATKG